MSDMTDVLADHRLDAVTYLVREEEYLCICGKRSDNHEEHQSRALSAAGFGPLTLVQIAARDRPEGMEAARAKVREERKAALRKQLQEARAEALEAAADSADGLGLTLIPAASLRARAAAERGSE